MMVPTTAQMKRPTQLVLLALIILVTGCTYTRPDSQNNNISITGSGVLVSQERALSGFDTIEAELTFSLIIQQGEEYRVVITADDNFIDYINVQQQGATISFGLKPGYAYNFYNTTMRAKVIMPEVTGLRLAGSSHAELIGAIKAENFEAELMGASSLTGVLEAVHTDLNVYGNAVAKLTGSGEHLGLDACGNSFADLSDFTAENAALAVSCASTAVVHVNQRLAGEVSQNARVYTVGQPAQSNIVAHEHAAVLPQ